jgi:hypothetical protein
MINHLRPHALVALLLAGAACAPPDLEGASSDDGLPRIRIAYPTSDVGPMPLTEDCRFETLVVVNVENFTVAELDPDLTSPERGHWHAQVNNVSLPELEGRTFNTFDFGVINLPGGVGEFDLSVDLRNDRHERLAEVPEENTIDDVPLQLVAPEGVDCAG